MSKFIGLENGFENKKCRGEATFRLFVAILGLTIGSILLMGILGLVLGWRTGVQFSNGFFIYGCLLIIFGVISVLGTFSARGTFEILYSQSISDMNLFERTSLWLADLKQGYNFLLIFFIPGIVLVSLGILIYQIFA